jgi:hypothetical protein
MARDTTAAANAGENGARGRGAHLPVLPEGWHYEVRLCGPEGEVTVAPDVTASDPAARYAVQVRPSTDHGERRPSFTRDVLADAVRDAAKAVKSLVKLGRHEAEAAAARRALLEQIGGEPAPSPPPADSPDPAGPADT